MPRIGLRTMLSATTSCGGALLIGIAGPAMAQEANAAPAAAPAAPAAPEGIEDIVVTAQKRSENLQTVPISVQVVTGETLARENKNTFEELSQTVPGVHVGTQSFSNNITIRGIGSGDNPAYETSVSLFVDDVYHGRSRLSSAAFLDLERIEFLKGPQGTYFGNNAIAGALNVVTAKPSHNIEGWGRALYGMHGHYALEGAITLPLAANLSARIAATYNGVNDGWITNINTGKKIPNYSNAAGRLTLLFDPSEAFDATLKLEKSHHKVSGASQDTPIQRTFCPPPAPLPPTFGSFGTCAVALGLGLPIGYDDNRVSSLPGEFNSLDTFESVLTANWHLGEHKLTAISAYQDYRFDSAIDVGQLPINVIGTIKNPETFHQFSQEIRLTSPSGGTFEYLVGGYFQTNKVKFNNFVNLPIFSSLSQPLGYDDPFAAWVHFGQRERTWSVFGSGTWNATDQIKLTAGLRASWIKKNFDGWHYYGTSAQTYGGFVRDLTVEPIVGSILGPAGRQQLTQTEHSLMPSVSARYEFTNDTMIYASYARGFKGGGFNGTDPFASPDNIQFGPEHVDAFEIGLKSKLFDNRVLFNIAAFRSTYSDLQVSATKIDPATNTGSVQTLNAGTSISQGVEIEGQFAVTSALRLRANLTYLDAHYTKFPNASPSDLQVFCQANYVSICSRFGPDAASIPATRDAKGERTAFSPKWSGNIGFNYAFEVAGGYRFAVDGSTYFTSKFNFDPDGLYPALGGYARIDGEISLESPNRAWTIGLVGRNLSNKLIPTSRTTKQEPRNISAQLRVRF